MADPLQSYPGLTEAAFKILQLVLRLSSLPFIFIGIFLIFGHFALNNYIAELKSTGVVTQGIVINKRVDTYTSPQVDKKKVNKPSLIERRVEYEFTVGSGKKYTGSYMAGADEYNAVTAGQQVKVIYLPSYPPKNKNYDTMLEEEKESSSMVPVVFLLTVGFALLLLPGKIISLGRKYIRLSPRP